MEGWQWPGIGINPSRPRRSSRAVKPRVYLQDGKWHYQGEPVRLIFLIRTEDESEAITPSPRHLQPSQPSQPSLSPSGVARR